MKKEIKLTFTFRGTASWTGDDTFTPKEIEELRLEIKETLKEELAKTFFNDQNDNTHATAKLTSCKLEVIDVD